MMMEEIMTRHFLGASLLAIALATVAPSSFSARAESVTTSPTTDLSAARAARRTTAVRGPRGNVGVRRTTVVRPGVRPVARPGVAAGRWVRPGYAWRPGGAIAAGAAIGFVSAATAAEWAGAAPGPGLCWY